ncbi:MAG: hydrogenase expression/formation protein HypE [Phycisphaerae bacterium]|nr:hydrogenase expression/formation protein HypE [Phycisphaerae bacterium]
MKANDKILLAHGGGGQLSDSLIHNTILPRLSNETLNALGDSALLDIDGTKLCFTTDSYVVKPLFFNGGDIGKLAVCGTVNDLAVAGARPLVLSLALIIETGFPIADLERILDSIAKTAAEAGVKVVTGDTKTVETGAADKIFINTAGIGKKLDCANLDTSRVKEGDKILVSGTIGDHGMTLISKREGIEFQSTLKSDCAALNSLTVKLLENLKDEIKFLRDPTRGGIAVTLNDIARGSGQSVLIKQSDIPVSPNVQAAADMLGFDILNIANEGKFIAVVSSDAAEKAVAICRSHRLGKDATIIGEIQKCVDVPTVEILTVIGGKRIVQMPYGRELPRIC